MKIAFHNRQRRRQIDAKALGLEFERLLGFLSVEIRQAPPAWLKKRQLQQIFLHGQLSVVLVSNKAMRVINKKWRGMDKATDVLSFPLDLTEPPSFRPGPGATVGNGKKLAAQSLDPKGLDSKDPDEPSLDFNQDDGGWLVGEVIISLERAQEQAQDYGHSIERELGFLFVHGVLHVLGFDHATKEEEKEMFGAQRRILAAAGIKRR